MGQVNELKDFTRGQIDAALMKIGQDVGMDTAEGIEAFLRGELTVFPRRAPLWREKKDVVYFSVKSDGTSGEQWVTRLEKARFCVSDYAPMMLRHLDFKPTTGVTTKIAVLKMRVFDANDRWTNNIYYEAKRRNLTKPNAEVACLIREKFTDDEIRAMGLNDIVVMHDQFRDFSSDPAFLSVQLDRSIGAHFQKDSSGWYYNEGCAFAVSSSPAESSAEKQVNTQQ